MTLLSKSTVTEAPRATPGIKVSMIKKISCEPDFVTKKGAASPRVVFTYVQLPTQEDKTKNRTLQDMVFASKAALPIDPNVPKSVEAWERFRDRLLVVSEALGVSLENVPDEEIAAIKSVEGFITFYDKLVNGVGVEGGKPAYINDDGSAKKVWVKYAYNGNYVKVSPFARPKFIQAFKEGQKHDIVWNENYDHKTPEIAATPTSNSNSNVNADDLPDMSSDDLSDLP